MKTMGINKPIRILIVSDIVTWTVSAAITIIIPIFTIQKIPGGTLTMAGMSVMFFYIGRTIGNIVMGRLMDQNKGHKDEFNIYTIGMFVRSVVVLLFIWATNAWYYYFVSLLSGLVLGSINPAWRVLFTRFTDKDKEATEWSLDLGAINLAMGIFTYLGAYAADKVDVNLPFILGSGITFLGGLVTLRLKKYI